MHSNSHVASPPGKGGYLPTLDGWRAIAVLGVVCFHAPRSSIAPISVLQGRGYWGVNLFFAISGILICSRLLREEAARGRIAWKEFYLRRAFRILPPAFVYLLLLAALGAAHVVRVVKGAWLAAAFFYLNYYSVGHRDMRWSPFTNHFWSLSVEEHFYLLLPAILLLVKRRRLQVLFSILGAVLLWTFYAGSHSAWVARLGGPTVLCWRTDIQISSLLFPAALAVLLQREWARSWTARWVRPALVIPALLVAGGASEAVLRGLHLHSGFFFQYGLIPLGFPFLILSTIFHPSGVAGRILEWRPLRMTGRISYSIYLYQQLFVIGILPPASGVFGYVQRFPGNLLALSVCAVASYWLIEKPCARLGHRLALPAAAKREEPATEPATTGSDAVSLA